MTFTYFPPPWVPSSMRGTRFTLSRFAVACLATLSLYPAAGLAQTPPAKDTSWKDTSWVVASFAGGIAKGSYQGGVDYVISEFLRRQRIQEFRDSVERKPGTLPNFKLGAATGASAGNINALFAALSWCTDRIPLEGGGVVQKIPAESSLFWKAWVNTGLTQMLPDALPKGKRREHAVLDRTFAEEQHKAFVWKYLKQAVPIDRNCKVPLGITMTKLTPMTFKLERNGGEVAVQRFATILKVGVDSTGRLDFMALREEDNAASLGALAVLPELRSTSPAGKQRRLESLFKVVLASSAFPVAFAPIKICYEGKGLAENPVTEAPPCAFFNDGGLFDNHPIGLALRLYEITKIDTARKVSALFSDPMRYRGDLAELRSRATGPRDHMGIGGLLQMVFGAMTSATKYELQGLARQISRDRELTESARDTTASRTAHEALGGPPTRIKQLPGMVDPSLLLSSRSSPIIGEELGSFAGFLGRAFREYDFYVGVYDGLEFVARHFICSDRGKESDSQERTSCTHTEHTRLVEDNLFGLSETALLVAQWHRDLEYKGRPAEPLRYSRNSRFGEMAALMNLELVRQAALTGIHNAMGQMRAPDPEGCPPRRNLMREQLCPRGFDNMIESLREDSIAMSALEALEQWCRHQPPNREGKKPRELGECTVDDRMLEFVKHPERELNRLAEKALVNLHDAEDFIREFQKDAPEYSAMVEAAFSQYRSATFRYRRAPIRLEFNPSTARWDTEDWTRVLGSSFAIILPNYVSLGGGRLLESSGATGGRHIRSTAMTAGWRPILLRASEDAYLTSSYEYSRYTSETPGDSKQDDHAGGLAVGSTVWAPPLMSSIEGGLFLTKHLLSDERDVPIKTRLGYALTGRFVAEKLYTSARWVPGYGYSFSLGLSDINGILYWVFR